ncbi:small lysine-rich protein 1 [Alligator mississippiensis]|uniref:small lysine-rich protein 1 n=1 Tax=Alligator mississippiensis TaxID=8496 RepID=UPI0009076879|nr:small lysine-rich protein 1 [Alligator mississippiensis]
MKCEVASENEIHLQDLRKTPAVAFNKRIEHGHKSWRLAENLTFCLNLECKLHLAIMMMTIKKEVNYPVTNCIKAGKGGKSKRGKGKSKGSKKKPKKLVIDVDILSPAAMLNAYYIAHNAPACLEFRGFPWPGSPKRKGKKGK